MVTWDYAQLSHIAKQMGGPEKLVQIISQHGMQKGLKLGLHKGLQLGFAGGAGTTLLAVGIAYLSYRTYKSLIVDVVTDEEAEAATQILVHEINNADKDSSVDEPEVSGESQDVPDEGTNESTD